MYVCVYKYCFIPSGCINICKYIPDVLSIHIYIYSFTHAGNYRYEEVLRVMDSISARTTSQQWTSRSMKAVSRSKDDRNHPMKSGGTIDGNTSENSQPENLHLVEQTWIWGGLEISWNLSPQPTFNATMLSCTCWATPWGERPMTKDNHLLGKFELHGCGQGCKQGK